jgi:hypothetical protein
MSRQMRSTTYRVLQFHALDSAKAVFGTIVVFAAYLYALTRWPVPWFAPIVARLAIATGVIIAYLRTACTEIIIDTARITSRQGILSRRVQSLELFRI